LLCQWASKHLDPQTLPLRHDEKRQIELAIQQLPSIYQNVVRWRIYDACSHGEIGVRLGLSENASRQMWIRALRRLRRILAPQFSLSR
jgi:DNA-directed RNA polymerase specialized sigma24 family protein